MNLPKIENLVLVTDREFPPRTPHSYSHLGAVALPELARIYEMLPTEQGQ